MKKYVAVLGLLAMPFFCSCRSVQQLPAPYIIDTHIHLYDTEREAGVDWPPPSDKVLYRPVLPEHFDAICAQNGVASTVIVEASSRPEDNQWMLDLVKHNPRRYRALVGSLPIGTDEFRPLLKRYVQNERFVGIRLRARAERDNFFTDAVWRDLRLLAKHDCVLDILLANFSLKDVDRIAEEVPNLKIMVNHVTGLEITGEPLDPAWIAEVREVAENENVYCKVSGIFQRSGKMPAPKESSYYTPVFEVVFNAFGEDRVVYGSNWPVTDRGGTYAEQLSIIQSYFELKGERVVKKLMADNARTFYGL